METLIVLTLVLNVVLAGALVRVWRWNLALHEQNSDLRILVRLNAPRQGPSDPAAQARQAGL